LDKARLSTLFVIVFVDLLGFSLILPLLPYYAEAFGANETVTGLLVASYAAAQLIGAPILGRLSDRYGRRPVLLVSVFGTFVGFLLLGFAGSLLVLFISRILDGLTGGNISVAQAYISDVTDQQNRARGLGIIGAAFGLGFIIGPAVGGVLSRIGAGLDAGGALEWQYALPAFAAAAVALLNLIQVFLRLPESLTEERRAALARQPQSGFNFDALRSAFTRPRVGPLLQIRFFVGLAFGTLQTIFPLYAQKHLKLEADQTAYILTYVGVLSVLVQGVAIGRLTRRYSENTLIHAAVILMAVSLLAWAFTPNVPVLLIVLAPVALAGGILNTVVNSALTQAVFPQEIGGTLGLSASVESATRVIAPSVGGFLLGTLGAWAPGAFGAIIMGWLVSFTWRRLIANPDLPPGARPGQVMETVPVETPR
jgi:DHA1 family tetracycline resistance protein-like MFS transporter